MESLIERLNKAKVAINKAFDSENSELMGKLAKLIQPLHQECYELWIQTDDNCKEYHYAEYLKSLILLHFEQLYDYGGGTEGLYTYCQVEMWKAGLSPNRITGEFIEEC